MTIPGVITGGLGNKHTHTNHIYIYIYTTIGCHKILFSVSARARKFSSLRNCYTDEALGPYKQKNNFVKYFYFWACDLEKMLIFLAEKTFSTTLKTCIRKKVFSFIIYF